MNKKDKNSNEGFLFLQQLKRNGLLRPELKFPVFKYLGLCLYLAARDTPHMFEEARADLGYALGAGDDVSGRNIDVVGHFFKHAVV